MTTKTLGSLGAMVRKKRGARKLRETAVEIGIGPATLMRVENGRIPDVTTFGKLCKWLNVDPGSFLGFEAASARRSETGEQPRAMTVAAHFKADQTLKQETANALARMILYAAKAMSISKGVPGDAEF